MAFFVVTKNARDGRAMFSETALREGAAIAGAKAPLLFTAERHD
jgi:hypothetical protein